MKGRIIWLVTVADWLADCWFQQLQNQYCGFANHFATVVAPTNHFHHLTLENSGLLRKISRPYAQAVLQYFQTAKVQFSAQKNGERIPTWLLLFLDFCSANPECCEWIADSSIHTNVCKFRTATKKSIWKHGSPYPAWQIQFNLRGFWFWSIVWFFRRSQLLCPFHYLVFVSFPCYPKPWTEPWWPD